MPTDTTGAALLRAVCLGPEDVQPRLILADWLEQEGGQPERAEFIQVQIRLAELRGHQHPKQGGPRGQTLPACRLCDEMEELESREDELIRFNATRWLWDSIPHDMLDGYGCWRHKGGLILPKRHDNGGFDFRRGFVEAVACTVAQWDRHGPAVVLAQPISEVRLVGREPYGCPHAERWYWFGPDERPYSGGRDSPATLPQEIYDLCSGWHPTEQAALDAASRACVTWARRTAGLDVPCKRCDGSRSVLNDGYDPMPRRSDCPDCKGAGWVVAP